MAQGNGTITEIRAAEAFIEPGEKPGQSGRITCPPALRPAPGQYLAAAAPDYAEPLPVALFPCGNEGDDLLVAPPLPSSWYVGMKLALRGPLGNGFHLPTSARRVALVVFEAYPHRLLPLAYQALAQHCEVALYAHRVPPGLPIEIEVSPMELLHEAPEWADFLALDLSLRDWSAARKALGLGLYSHLTCPAQALITVPMPCSGLSECGACAVPTRDGWRLACSDGPVFDFNAVEAG